MRRARIETTHGDAETARQIAAALGPDNTAEMDTRVDGDSVITTIQRDATGGLHSTVDDYVVNCSVAAQLANRQSDDNP
ncbi:MAG: KEOPS complex subunit Pcc1 [Haloarculaceae archaeon]